MRCSKSVPAGFACALTYGFGVAMLAAGLLPGCVSTSAAQAKPALNQAVPMAPAAAAKPADFSKEALVLNKLDTRIREEADGTGTRQTTATVRILADAGVKAMAVLAFTYTASNQVMDIGYVRVI